MKLALFSTVIVILYLSLAWFSVRSSDSKLTITKLFFIPSGIVFSFLSASYYQNLFISLFVVTLILVLAIYIGDKKFGHNRALIKNGIYGGIWLSMPIYIYLAINQ